MRKLFVSAAVALFLLAAAAAAAEEPAPADLAKAACKAEKHELGTKLFKKTYGAKSTSKAMKACVAKVAPEAKNAAHACKALERDDPEGFEEQYGKRKNAFGKCVSATAQADDE